MPKLLMVMVLQRSSARGGGICCLGGRRSRNARLGVGVGMLKICGVWVGGVEFTHDFHTIFHMGVSKNRGTPNGWFVMEIPIKMDDLGENPPFSETRIYSGDKLINPNEVRGV